MKIAVATDAWFPQVNGVVRTLAATVAELDRRGYEVELITPERFRTVPLPGYSSIDVALVPRFSTRKLLGAFAPDIVHIPTEGPIGWSARGWCLKHGVPYTSAFHTRFPEYAALRTGLSAERFWPLVKRFHRESAAVLVATPSLERELQERGIANTRPWTRGLDHWLFRPDGEQHPAMADLPRPILLNVGRVAQEKNLEAFLSLETRGSKVIVGDGPAIESLKARYPDAHFLGAMTGEALASAYRTADCFVFPSLTDTFGLVVIEALACGLPVAAFPVAGPVDLIGRTGHGADGTFPAAVGSCDSSLDRAVGRALQADRKAAAVFARRFSWETATDQFVAALETAWHERRPAHEPAGAPAFADHPSAGSAVL